MNHPGGFLFAALFMAGGALAADDGKPMDTTAPIGISRTHYRMILNQEYIRYHEEVLAQMTESKSELIDTEDLEIIHSGVLSVCSAVKASSLVAAEP